MNLKEIKKHSVMQSIASLSKEEKAKKTIFTYTIVGLSCAIFVLLGMPIVISVIISLMGGILYFFRGPVPKIKPKKAKKRSSLDEEYLREYDKENNETEV